MRDPLIAFMAATAQAQAEATKEAQRAGIKAAREGDDSTKKYKGRKPRFDAEKLQRVHEMDALGLSPTVIATEVGLTRQVVYRIKADPAKAAALLQAWAIAWRDPAPHG